MKIKCSFFVSTVAICCLIFVKNISFAQSYESTKDYLQAPNKTPIFLVRLMDAKDVRQDFKFISSYHSKLKLSNQYGNILCDQYKLGKNVLLDIGIGKIGADSIICFSVIKNKTKYYILKQPCNIKLVGYNFYRKQLLIYCELKSNNYSTFFSPSLDKSYTITEFDFINGK